MMFLSNNCSAAEWKRNYWVKKVPQLLLSLLLPTPLNPSPPPPTFSSTLSATAVVHWLSTGTGTINIVTADGIKFAHPLQHLGKTKKVASLSSNCCNLPLLFLLLLLLLLLFTLLILPLLLPFQDLPVLAIDSFRHMFLFPNFEAIQ